MAVTSRRVVAATGMATIVVAVPWGGSAADGFEDESGGLGSGEVLLAGHEVAVADGEGAEGARLDVVGPELADLVLDAPGHDVRALWECARFPGHAVGGVLLDVREAGHGLARHQWVAVGEPGVGEDRGAVAERGGDLAGLVELDELAVQLGGVGEGEHRALAARHDERVVGVDVELGDGAGVLDQLAEGRVVLVAAGDLVLGLPPAGVVGVAHGVPLAVAAVGGVDVDLPTGLGEGVVRVGQLGPPEADGPAGGGRDPGVGDDDRGPLGPGGVHGVEVAVAHGFSSVRRGGSSSGVSRRSPSLRPQPRPKASWNHSRASASVVASAAGPSPSQTGRKPTSATTPSTSARDGPSGPA